MAGCSFTHLPVIHLMLTEHLLYSRYCPRCQGYVQRSIDITSAIFVFFFFFFLTERNQGAVRLNIF